MAQKKYTDGSGVSEIWLNIKNYVYSQLLGKADASHTHTKSQITDLDLSNYVDKTSNQTVAGNKEFTGTTTAHDVIPSATDTYNLGSSSYQWNNAYIKSLTINGKAPAYDSDVVHVKGTDDIIDSKTFISLYTQSSGPSLWMKNTSFTMGTAPTTNRYSGIWVQDNNGTDTAYIVHQANKNNSQNLKFSVSNTDGTTVYQNALTFQGRLDGTFNFYSDNPANLGTSTNKWKSVYSNSYYLGTTAFGDIVTHNASEFVHANDLATVATSGSYNDLSDKPNPYTPPTFTYDSSTETLTVSNTTATVFNYDSNTETLEIQING